MKRILLPLLLAASATAAFAQEEAKPLSIGDLAPAFKSDGHIKGEKIDKLEKGKAYVIEFWATWCGPCIAVFPHLSELTKKYEGQVTTISVNTWDYPRDSTESKEAHTKRILDFVAKQGDKMAYNIVLDDDKDTMATTWMRAAGQNGIPTAFIVNEEGLIAWIGHPASMDEPLAQIAAKTWDIAAAKTKFDEEARAEIEAAKKEQEMVAKIKELAKTSDLKGFDALVEENGVQAVYAALDADANFAVKVIEKYAGKLEDLDHTSVCSMAAYLVGEAEVTEANKKTALKVSEGCFNKVKPSEAALAAIYHARALNAAGNKAEAVKWADKATGLVDKYEPAEERPGILKFIEDSKKTFTASR